MELEFNFSYLKGGETFDKVSKSIRILSQKAIESETKLNESEIKLNESEIKLKESQQKIEKGEKEFEKKLKEIESKTLKEREDAIRKENLRIEQEATKKLEEAKDKVSKKREDVNKRYKEVESIITEGTNLDHIVLNNIENEGVLLKKLDTLLEQINTEVENFFQKIVKAKEEYKTNGVEKYNEKVQQGKFKLKYRLSDRICHDSFLIHFDIIKHKVWKCDNKEHMINEKISRDDLEDFKVLVSQFIGGFNNFNGNLFNNEIEHVEKIAPQTDTQYILLKDQFIFNLTGKNSKDGKDGNSKTFAMQLSSDGNSNVEYVYYGSDSVLQYKSLNKMLNPDIEEDGFKRLYVTFGDNKEKIVILSIEDTFQENFYIDRCKELYSGYTSGGFCNVLPYNINFDDIIKNGLDSYNKGKDIKILKKDNIYWTPFIECNFILGNLKDLGYKDFPYRSGSFDESSLENNLYYYNYNGKTYISLLVYNYITKKNTNLKDVSGGSNEFELIYHLNDSNIQEGGSDLEQSIENLQEDLRKLKEKTESEMKSKQEELTNLEIQKNKAESDAQKAEEAKRIAVDAKLKAESDAEKAQKESEEVKLRAESDVKKAVESQRKAVEEKKQADSYAQQAADAQRKAESDATEAKEAQLQAENKVKAEDKELEYSYSDHKQDLRKLKIFKDYVEKVNKKDLLDIINLPLNRRRNINESDKKRLLDAIRIKDNKLGKYKTFDELALNILAKILQKYIKSKGKDGEKIVTEQINDNLKMFKEDILKFFNLSNIDSYNR